jgi:hypothetical protein
MVNTIERMCVLNEKGKEQVGTGDEFCVLHQNIRSLWGKCRELEILIETDIKNVDMLCFTEHWLNYYEVHAININCFTLANAFCRTNKDCGGSCIFVKKGYSN